MMELTLGDCLEVEVTASLGELMQKHEICGSRQSKCCEQSSLNAS